MNKQIITIVLVAVVFGGGGFYAGTKSAQGQRPGSGNLGDLNGQRQGNLQQFNGGMPGGQRGGAGGGFTVGEVVSSDATSITLKLQDGGSKLILISDETPISKSTSGSLSDIKPGEQIMVVGSSNSDGSINAQSIQLGSNQMNFRQPTSQTQQ